MQVIPGGVQLEQSGGELRVTVSAPRAPTGALALMLFGVLAVGLVTLSSLAVMPAHNGDGAGLLAAVFFAAVALPVAGFGAAFVLIGAAALGTARTVHATTGGLRVRRSFIGVPTGAWDLARGELAAVEVRAAPKYQNIGAASVRVSVVAVRRGGRAVTLADALGEDSAPRLRQALMEALELADTSSPGVPHDPHDPH